MHSRSVATPGRAAGPLPVQFRASDPSHPNPGSRLLAPGGVEPLAVRTARTARQFLATEMQQFAGDVAVLHAASTKHSNQMGVFRVLCCRLGGRGRPKSSYNSTTALS